MIIEGLFSSILHKKHMLWVLIRIASARGEAILMCSHNIYFYGEISKIIH